MAASDGGSGATHPRMARAPGAPGRSPAAPSSCSECGVDIAIQHIHQHVHRDHQGREYQEQYPGSSGSPGENRIDEKQPHPGPAEDGLGEDGAAAGPRTGDNRGDHRDEHVPQDMAVDEALRGRPLARRSGCNPGTGHPGYWPASCA